MVLLRGDGSCAREAALEVPVLEELAAFAGEFVSTVENARQAVRRFLASGDLAATGEWVSL